MRLKKKGFTLIEVIAVLVILSMIFLIVTPLVMSIIKKAKDSADKRSIDVYGKTVEIAAVAYMLDDTEFPTSFDDLIIEYTGSKVECAVNIVNYDGRVFLDKCAVNGRLIKDSKFSSGYYQYGRDTGNYMFTLYKSITEVVNNSSNGSAGNVIVNNGSNGSTTGNNINISGTVTYNGNTYYRLTNINVNAGYAALTPQSPLSYEDMVKYAGDIPVTNINGYGYVTYYTSDTCNESNNTGCKTDYDSSNVKIIIDAWAKDNLNDGSNASAMTIDYLTSQGYALVGNNIYQKTSTTPNNLFSLGIDYWAIDSNGNIYKGASTFKVTYPYDTASIRPIIIVPKGDVKVNTPSNNGSSNTSNGTPANSVTNDSSNPYTVDNIIMFISIAVIVICAIIYVIYIISRKNSKEDKKAENTNK